MLLNGAGVQIPSMRSVKLLFSNAQDLTMGKARTKNCPEDTQNASSEADTASSFLTPF